MNSSGRASQPSADSVTAGCLCNDLPFVCCGRGPQTIVVFPHIRDCLEGVTRSAWSRRWLKRFGKNGHRVYIIGRRKHLSPACTTADMARDYARAIEKHIGPAHIMGFSLGGLIAQHVAAGHPHCVISLVLAVSAHRTCPSQLEGLHRWISLAENRDWQNIYLDIASLMHTGITQDMRETVLPFLGRALRRHPPSPADFIALVRASLKHDATAVLPAIRARTLIIGGTRDRLFPVSIFREAAGLIPLATLRLMDGAGHGAFDERKREFDRAVLEFWGPSR